MVLYNTMQTEKLFLMKKQEDVLFIFCSDMLWFYGVFGCYDYAVKFNGRLTLLKTSKTFTYFFIQTHIHTCTHKFEILILKRKYFLSVGSSTNNRSKIIIVVVVQRLKHPRNVHKMSYFNVCLWLDKFSNTKM